MNKKIKVITYNIDGLPDTLDLNDLPWVLKFIPWIYKMIKKTTIIKINDNSDTANNIKKISSYLKKSKPDIIGVQEDFNYHYELMTDLNDYSYGTRSEKFSLDNLFSKIECWTHFPLPRFKSDGINILTNHATTMLLNEVIVPWNKSNGYISHANDTLTHKGFRLYTVALDEDILIDVYILHMDADFYHPEKCPDVSKDVEARKSQFNQLVKFISEKYKENINKENGNRPIIIMGDTNSYNKYNWDVDNIVDNLISPINKIMKLYIDEAVPENYEDCDRIFYINNLDSKYELKLKKCYFDIKLERLSDHKPLIAEFEIINKTK